MSNLKTVIASQARKHANKH